MKQAAYGLAMAILSKPTTRCMVNRLAVVTFTKPQTATGTYLWMAQHSRENTQPASRRKITCMSTAGSRDDRTERGYEKQS
jgi:hypothetical protein